LHKKIKFELEEIGKELKEYEDLLKKVQKKDPDKIEKAALATILHSFYTGIEKIFKIISKTKLKYNPTGKSWHKDLLNKMQKEIISEKLYNDLIEYLSFRHLYRNSYDFSLNWDEMQGLVKNIFDTWKLFKKEIQNLD
jgi:DNA polymerase III alpha subunit (gram-positive type)